MITQPKVADAILRSKSRGACRDSFAERVPPGKDPAGHGPGSRDFQVHGTGRGLQFSVLRFLAPARPGDETLTMTLAQARKIALAFPESVEAPHFEYTSFRVKGKIFATAPPGGGFLHVFVGEEERRAALAAEGAALEELEWGARVVGLRVTLAKAPAGLVRHLLELAWTARAPKTVVAAWRAARGGR